MPTRSPLRQRLPPSSQPPPSPASDALANLCVRESRITTEADARARRIAGLSLGSVTLAASALWSDPNLGFLGLLANASMFGFLQGHFHQ